MSKCSIGILLAGCIIILIVVDYNHGVLSMFVSHSDIDQRKYNVVHSMSNYDKAADMLAKINRANIAVIKYMKQKYVGTHYEKHIDRLAEKYNPDVLGEHIPIGTENTSYVTNKGEKIRFCLRPNTNRYMIHDWNILMFVSLHEISHIMNVSTGHDNDFWNTFKFILKNAAEIGVYKPVDYSVHPTLYCNIQVTYNPLFDESLVTMVV